MATMRKSANTGNGRASKKRRVQRRSWTKADHRDLKKHSKAKTPVTAIARAMKRSIGALRQQARKLGLGLGHRR